jgi:hypothetical protein
MTCLEHQQQQLLRVLLFSFHHLSVLLFNCPTASAFISFTFIMLGKWFFSPEVAFLS